MSGTLSDFLAGFPVVEEERDGYVVACPAHEDGHPSLRVALRDGALMLHCRAGCAKAAVLEALGLSTADLFSWEAGDAVKVADASSGPPSEAHLVGLHRLVLAFEDCWQGPNGREGEHAWRYAIERFGLDGDQARQLRLGFSPEGFAGAWVRRAFNSVDRLVVPFLGWDGRPHGMQGRAIGADHDSKVQRWVGLGNPPGASWSKVAVMRQDTGLDYVVVTEGPGDAMTAYGAGVSAVAVRGAGLGANEELRQELVAGLADMDAKVVVCGDADEAGRGFQEEVAAGLADAGGLHVSTLELPDGHEDLNAWRVADPAGFPAALERALRAARRTVPESVGHEPAAAPGAAARPDGARGDVRVALDVLEHAAGGIRYNAGVGFLHWTGYAWRVDGGKDSPRTRAAVHAQGQRYAELAEAALDEAAAKALNGLATKAQSSRSVDGILKELAALKGVPVSAEELDAQEHLLAVRNGTVDLRTGELRPSDPADLLTAALGVDYRPTALAPRWRAFLEEAACGQEGWAEYLQRATGYGITGSIAEACFLVHLGTGGNGKSVFMGVLEEVLQSITRVTGFGTFEERQGGGATPELAALRGARLVMASEGAANKHLDEAMVKRVTGGERMEVRQLYKEPSTYRPAFLIMLATNHRPGIKGGDEGIWRRVRLVEWNLRLPVEEQDRTLTATLVREEAEGILAWAVEGAAAWYREGLGTPPCVEQATEDFRASSDELAGFLPGVYHLTGGKERLMAVDVFRRYQDWVDEEGGRPWGKRALYNALEERGVKRTTDPRGMAVLVGVAETPEGLEKVAEAAHVGHEAHGSAAITRVQGKDALSFTKSDCVVNGLPGTREPAEPARPSGPSWSDLPDGGGA